MMGGDYKDLVVWQKAFELVLAIYRESAHFPSDEKYGPTIQLRRAGVSIVSNIAEGQGRCSTGEFLHHLSFSLGSLKEVETQLLVANELKYLKQNQFARLMAMVAEVGRLITGLSKSLRSSTTNH